MEEEAGKRKEVEEEGENNMKRRRRGIQEEENDDEKEGTKYLIISPRLSRQPRYHHVRSKPFHDAQGYSEARHDAHRARLTSQRP